MTDVWNALHDAYENGADDDGASLTPAEHELYLIVSFIIEFEKGGWLYNWSSQPDKFDETAAAMSRRGLNRLAELVAEAGLLLRPIEMLKREMGSEWQNITWGKILNIIDPDDKLTVLETRIRALQDYGLPEQW